MRRPLSPGAAAAAAAALLLGAASAATMLTLRRQWLTAEAAQRRAAREPPRAHLARSDLPDPWCQGNGTCGMPSWPPQWNLTESTIMYFMDTGGFDADQAPWTRTSSGTAPA
jgi:hypothetical protein